MMVVSGRWLVRLVEAVLGRFVSSVAIDIVEFRGTSIVLKRSQVMLAHGRFEIDEIQIWMRSLSMTGLVVVADNVSKKEVQSEQSVETLEEVAARNGTLSATYLRRQARRLRLVRRRLGYNCYSAVVAPPVSVLQCVTAALAFMATRIATALLCLWAFFALRGNFRLVCSDIRLLLRHRRSVSFDCRCTRAVATCTFGGRLEPRTATLEVEAVAIGRRARKHTPTVALRIAEFGLSAKRERRGKLGTVAVVQPRLKGFQVSLEELLEFQRALTRTPPLLQKGPKHRQFFTNHAARSRSTVSGLDTVARRPNCSVERDPSAWWRYAFFVVVARLRERLPRAPTFWHDAIEAIRIRDTYVQLFAYYVLARNHRRRRPTAESEAALLRHCPDTRRDLLRSQTTLSDFGSDVDDTDSYGNHHNGHLRRRHRHAQREPAPTRLGRAANALWRGRSHERIDREKALGILADLEKNLTQDQILLYRAISAVAVVDVAPFSARTIRDRSHEFDCIAVDLRSSTHRRHRNSVAPEKWTVKRSAIADEHVGEAPAASILGFDTIEVLASQAISAVATYSDAASSDGTLLAEVSFFAMQFEFGKRLEMRVDDVVVTSSSLDLANVRGVNFVLSAGNAMSLSLREPTFVVGPALTALTTAVGSLATKNDDDITIKLVAETDDCHSMTDVTLPRFLDKVSREQLEWTIENRRRRRPISLRMTDLRIDIVDKDTPAMRLLASSAHIHRSGTLDVACADLDLVAQAVDAGGFQSCASIDHLHVNVDERQFQKTICANISGNIKISCDPCFSNSLQNARERARRTLGSIKSGAGKASNTMRETRTLVRATINSATLEIPHIFSNFGDSTQLVVNKLTLAHSSRAGDSRFDLHLATLTARDSNGETIIDMSPSHSVQQQEEVQLLTRSRSRGNISSSKESSAPANAVVLSSTSLETNETSVFVTFGDVRAQGSPTAVEAIAPAALQWFLRISGEHDSFRDEDSMEQNIDDRNALYLNVKINSLNFDCYLRDETTRIVAVVTDNLSIDGHTALRRWKVNSSNTRLSGGPNYGYRDVFEIRESPNSLSVDFDGLERTAEVSLYRPRGLLSGKFFREVYRYFHDEEQQICLFCRPIYESLRPADTSVDGHEPRATSNMADEKRPTKWKVSATGFEILAPRCSNSDDVVALKVGKFKAMSNDDSSIAWPSCAKRQREEESNWHALCRVNLDECEMHAALGASNEGVPACYRVPNPGGVDAGAKAFQRFSEDGTSLRNPAEPRWRSLSNTCLSNLRVAIDSCEKSLRILIEDVASTGFAVDASMSEFYTVLSACYFDNYQESASPWVPPAPVPLFPYGTDPWIQAMIDDDPRIEVAVQLSTVSLNLSLDDIEGSLVPSWFMAKPSFGTRPEHGDEEYRSRDRLSRKRLPFATVSAEGLLVLVQNATQSVTVSVGAQKFFLRDDRVHVAGAMPPYSLILGQRHDVNTFAPQEFLCDPTLGLREGRHSIVPPNSAKNGAHQKSRRRLSGSEESVSLHDCACLVTVRLTQETIVVAVGVNAPQILANDLGLAWLLADYFKLYFTRPEDFQGPPSYIERLYLPPQRPPRSVDVKVVGLEPHVAVAETNLSGLNKSHYGSGMSTSSFKAVSLTIESGVFVRWNSTSDESLFLEVAAHGLQAAVCDLVDAARRMTDVSSNGTPPGLSFDRRCDARRSMKASRVICGGSTSFGLVYSYDARFDHVDARFESPLSRNAISTPYDTSALAAHPVEPYPTSACDAAGGSISGRFRARYDFADALDGDPLFVAGRHRPSSFSSNDMDRSRAGALVPFRSKHLIGDDAEKHHSRVIATVEDILLITRIATSLLGPFDDAADCDEPTYCDADTIPLNPEDNEHDKQDQPLTQDNTLGDTNGREGSTSNARIHFDAIDVAVVDSVLKEYLPIVRVRLRRFSCASYVAHDVDESLILKNYGDNRAPVSSTESSAAAMAPDARPDGEPSSPGTMSDITLRPPSLLDQDPENDAGIMSPQSLQGRNTRVWKGMEPSLAYAVGKDASQRPLATHVMLSAPSIAADYFNSMLKCWEPLIEPFEVEFIVELSPVSAHIGESDQVFVKHHSLEGLAMTDENDAVTRESTHRNRLDSVDKLSSRLRGNGVCVRAPKRIDINLTDASVEPLLRASVLVALAVEEAGTRRRQNTMPPRKPAVSARDDRASAKHASRMGDRNDEFVDALESVQPLQMAAKTTTSSLFAEDASMFGESSSPRATDEDSLSIEESDGDDKIPWRVEHVRARWADDTRDAFSLSNHTGLQVRTYQPQAFATSSSAHRKSDQYLVYVENNQKTSMLFSATKTVPHNRRIREVAFSDQATETGAPCKTHQREYHDPEREEIDVQLPGFRWVRVLIDEFRRPGVSFHQLRPMIGNVGANAVLASTHSRSAWAYTNALRLAADVQARAGGRALSLRSVFGIRNCSGHALEVRFDISDLTRQSVEGEVETSHRRSQESYKALEDAFDAHTFILETDDSAHVPVAAIHDALLQSKARSLGALNLRAATRHDVATALGGDFDEQRHQFVSQAPARTSWAIPSSQSTHHTFAKDADGRTDARISFFTASSMSSGAIEEKLHDDVSSDVAESPRNFFGRLRQGRRARFSDSRIALRDLVLQSRRQFAQTYTVAESSTNIVLDDAVVRTPFSGEESATAMGSSSIPSGRAAVDAPPSQALSLKCSTVDESSDVDSFQGSNFGRESSYSEPVERPICYCIEVRRSPLYPASDSKSSATSEEPVHAPVDYEIVVHAPLRITNNLAETAQFEIVHATSGNRLWTVTIEAGASVPVHTVGLDVPLGLNIRIHGYCRPVDAPAVIHPPADEHGHSDVNTYATVADEVGQRLHICVTSRIGGGGQRHVIAYVPFWMVNSTQFSLRYAQEGNRDHLPAGTVPRSFSHVLSEPGTDSAVIESLSNPTQTASRSDVTMRTPLANRAGAPGPLAPERLLHETSNMTPSHELISEEMDEEALCANAFMFSFNMANNASWSNDVSGQRKKNASTASAMGNSRRRGFASAASTFFAQSPQLQIQVDNSEWSSSFSLDTIGVSQVLAVKDSLKGLIELGFSISFAPGARAGFTKVVRFVPRYIILNRLERPLKLFQNLALTRVVPINEIPSNASRPFHLPKARAESNLQLQPSGPWERTPPFQVDVAHDFFLRVPRSVNDPVPAFSSRSDEYIVHVPSNPPLPEDAARFDLGLWLETDWKQQGIVVKRVKPRTYAQVETDITKGDELLEVNGKPLKQLSFNEALEIIRNAADAHTTTGQPIDLKFRSAEARMRMIRMRALHRTPEEHVGTSRDDENTGDKSDMNVSVEIKAVGASVLLEVVPMDTKFPPYRIVNRSASHRILYRQRDVQGIPWLELEPRTSVLFVWEDPMKSRRSLQLRVAADLSQGDGDAIGIRPKSALRLGTLGLVVSDSSAAAAGGSTRSILMDEIDQKEKLPIPSVASENTTDQEYVYARVDAEGPTRVLVITDMPTAEEQLVELSRTIENTLRNVERARRSEFERSLALQVQTTAFETPRHRGTSPRDHSDLIAFRTSTDGREDSLPPIDAATLSSRLTIKNEREVPSQLARRNQQLSFGPTTVHRLFVEVLEARNLFSRTLNGLADPYCEVVMKTPYDTFMRRKRYYTYYVEKTLNPKWKNQIFELKVPSDAVEIKRGVMLRVKVQDFSLFGTHSFLGQCDVQVSNLQDEQEHIGWFPLVQRTERIYRSQDIVTGYLRLRVRWVYTRMGLLHSKYAASVAYRLQLENTLAAQQSQLRALQMQQKRKSLGRVLSQQFIDEDRGTTFLDFIRKYKPTSRSLIGGKRWRNVRRNTNYANRKQLEAAAATATAEDLTGQGEHRLSDIAGMLSPLMSPIDRREKWTRKLSRAKQKLMREIREAKERPEPIMEDEAGAHLGSSKASRSEFLMHKMRHAHSQERLAILERVRESFTRVKTEGGTLRIRPLQALNLNQYERPAFLNVRYGLGTGDRSAPSSPGVVHLWARDGREPDGANSTMKRRAAKKNKRDKDRFPEVVEVPIEEGINNSFGSLQLSVFVEHVTSSVETGRVELPIMNVLECLSSREEYVRWFPLAPAGDCVHFEGDDGESWWVRGAERVHPNHYRDQMCIQLALSWEPNISHQEHPTKFYLCAVLGGVSVTLSKSKPATSLLQATMSDIELVVEETSKRTRLATVVNWIQIDNQLPYCNEAVVLAPTLVDSLQPVFQLRASRNNAASHDSFLSMKYISVNLQELDIRIDQGLLLELWHFVGAASKKIFLGSQADAATSSVAGASEDENSTRVGGRRTRRQTTATNKPNNNSSSGSGSKVYIERLWLFPVKVNLTIGKGSENLSTHENSHENTMPVNDTYTYFQFHGLALQAFIKLLADFLLSVTTTLNGAPIKLNALFVWHIFNTPEHIASSLREHYISSLLKQLYRVVASLDYIGNPMSLVKSLGTGFHDFFFEPVEGLFLGPSAFARGAVRGTLSLVGNATSGILSTAARVTTTVGKIVAYPVLDADYNRWRLNQQLKGSRRSFQPIYDIGSGFARGITGIVLDPYRGAKRDGVKGFATGLFKGVLGVAVKPVVGVIDAYAHATEHLQKFTTQLITDRRVAVRRLRFGPNFGLDSRLLPYDFAMALSQSVVREHPIKRASKRNNRIRVDIPEVIVWSEVLGGPSAGKLLFVTPHRTVYAKIRQDHGFVQIELEWAALLSGDEARIDVRLSDMGNSGGAELFVVRRPGGNNSGKIGRRRANGPSPGGNENLTFGRGARWLGAEYDGDECRRMVTVDASDHRVLRRMYSAINAVIGNFSELEEEGRRALSFQRGAHTSPRHLGAGLVAFGDWVFGPERALDPTLLRLERVLDDLSVVDWYDAISGSTTYASNAEKPTGAHPLFERAQEWHKQARSLAARAKSDPRDTDRIALFKQKLRDNVISASEFEQFVQAEEILFKQATDEMPALALEHPLISRAASSAGLISATPPSELEVIRRPRARRVSSSRTADGTRKNGEYTVTQNKRNDLSKTFMQRFGFKRSASNSAKTKKKKKMTNEARFAENSSSPNEDGDEDEEDEEEPLSASSHTTHATAAQSPLVQRTLLSTSSPPRSTLSTLFRKSKSSSKRRKSWTSQQTSQDQDKDEESARVSFDLAGNEHFQFQDEDRVSFAAQSTP